MNIFKAFQIVLFYASCSVFAQSNLIFGPFLLPPIREPQIFNVNVFKSDQLIHNSNKRQPIFQRNHFSHFSPGENDWKPMNNPYVPIDMRNDNGPQERIVYFGDNKGRNKNLASENRYRNGALRRPQTKPLAQNQNNTSGIVYKSFYSFTPPSSEGLINSPKVNVVELKTVDVKPKADQNHISTYSLESHRKLQDVEVKLASVLEAFEGNLSRILELAAINASKQPHEIAARKSIADFTSLKASGHQTAGDVYSLPRQKQSNPSISGSPSFALIGRRAPPLAGAGYISPPILNLNSNGHGNGTFDYREEHGYGRQEVGIEGRGQNIPIATVATGQSDFNNNSSNSNFQNTDRVRLNAQVLFKNWNHTSKLAKFDQALTTDVNGDLKIGGEAVKHSNSNQEDSALVKPVYEIENENRSNGDESNLARRGKVDLNVVKRTSKSKRNFEEGKDEISAAETIVRGNRASARHTAIDFRGLNHFNHGFNSLDHLPPDPYVALLLSHYGRYLPSGNILTTQYRNLYSYLATNNIHNNKPFGAYKIYEDADG